MIGSIRVSYMGKKNKKIDFKEGPRGKLASQVNFGVRQLLAMNPDSPLGISKRYEYQNREKSLI